MEQKREQNLLLRGGRIVRETKAYEDLGSQDEIFSQIAQLGNFPLLLDFPIALHYGSGLKPIQSTINFFFSGTHGTKAYAAIRLPFLDACTGYAATNLGGAEVKFEKGSPVKEENLAFWSPIWGYPQSDSTHRYEKLINHFVFLPNLFFIVEIDRTMLIPGREETSYGTCYLFWGNNNDKKWRKVPFPNIHADGHVCMGREWEDFSSNFNNKAKEAKAPLSIASYVSAAVKSFLSSRSNHDLWEDWMAGMYLLNSEQKSLFPDIAYVDEGTFVKRIESYNKTANGTTAAGTVSRYLQTSYRVCHDTSRLMQLSFRESLSEIARLTSTQPWNDYSVIQEVLTSAQAGDTANDRTSK